MKRVLIGAALALALVSHAHAAVLPTVNCNPNFVPGQVPSAAQWNAPSNCAFPKAGGTIQGPIGLPPSSTATAPLNIPPGAAPTAPSDGDIWVTSAGLFVRIAGVTVGPLGTGGGGGSAPVNSILPVISGTPQVGSTLTVSHGTWTGSPTPTLADQWLSNGSSISGQTGTTYVPVTGDVGATISVRETASNTAGSASANAAGVGPVTPQPPAFVAATCGSSFPSTGICADLISSSTGGHVIGGQVWDGTTQTTVAPSTLLSDTRSVAAPYDPGTSITTSVAANTLPIGSAGLQVFQNNVNYELASGGNYTSTAPGGVWITSSFVTAAPTRTLNPNFGGSGCTITAPDGSCNTTEITVPAVAAGQQSSVAQLISGLTASTPYTFYIWLKNSAATSNPQTYLFVQQGSTPFSEIARSLVQPGSSWQRFPITFTTSASGAGSTSVFVSIGNCTSTTAPCTEGQLGGGTFEAWVSQVNLGTAPAPYVPTTTVAATTIALDAITATGDLATALAAAKAVSVTTKGAGNAVAGTMLDSNGTVLLGKSANDNVTTALGATLTSKAKGNFPASESAFLTIGSGGSSINLNGTPVATDATARTPAAPFHVGATSGTSAPINGYITAIAVYPSAVSPPLVASAPLTGVILGNIATISSGTLGNTVTTFVNGDTWIPTEDASGNVWTLGNDAGYSSFTSNVLLTEASFTTGTPGFLNMGSAPINTFAAGPLGGETAFIPSTTHTWKSCGLIAITDGGNTDLFAGLVLQNDVSAAPWNFNSVSGTIASVTAANAATSASWNGLPPFSGSLQPVASPTFNAQQFGNPCFVQYAPGYANSTLPVSNPDNSGAYLYAISNDGGWNYGSNVYLARIPLATIETSLGGSLAAASTAGNWQFYISTGCAGGDGTNSACWTSTLASATPIFNLPNELGRSAMTYLPTTNRYVLQSWYYPTNNGPTSGTQTQAQLATTSQFVFVDCDKPWHCTGVVSTFDAPTQGFYEPAVVPPSLALDGGLTATAIFTGNFVVPPGSQAFSSAATYTPTMGQMTFRY
jgi:hypothetical protein